MKTSWTEKLWTVEDSALRCSTSKARNIAQTQRYVMTENGG